MSIFIRIENNVKQNEILLTQGAPRPPYTLHYHAEEVCVP
jgi:hypothetical protein